MAGKSPSQFDCTPEELRLANERAKLRNALRAEYLRKFTDPHHPEPVVFDPCMQRYYSMHQTYFDRFVPNLKNFGIWCLTIVIPIVGYGWYLKNSREQFERDCRSGKIKYEDRVFKFN